ncbi:MAG: nitroreductase family protein [Magnetococcus sp. WYHC-3]
MIVAVGQRIYAMTGKREYRSADVEWGVPSIDMTVCVGCRRCADVCPSFSLCLKDGKPSVVSDGVFGCLACGHCMAVCPSGAVRVTGRGMTADDVFPLPPASARATTAALEGVLQARRSVRHYEDKPVEKAIINHLLAMSASAPMGFPPSSVGVVVINGKERVQELAKDLTAAFQKWLFLGTPVGSVVLRLMMDKPSVAMMRTFVLPVAKVIIEARKENRDLLFYDAPCVILFHYPMKDTVDPTIACSFATLAAETLGLGSCMIGTVPPALQGDKKLKRKWGIPEKSFPSIAMTLGYPSVAFRNGIRRRFKSVEYVEQPGRT